MATHDLFDFALATAYGAVGSLRKQRKGDDFLAACGLKPVQRGIEGGVAVAHSQFGYCVDALFLEALVDALRLKARIDDEGRAFCGPDLLVSRRSLFRTFVGDEQVKDGQPQCAGHVDEVWIGQELDKVRLDIPRVGGIRRAGVHEHEADLFALRIHEANYSKMGAPA